MEDEFSAEEGKNSEEAGRGHRAQSLLNNPLLAEAFETLRAAYRQGMEEAPVRDVEGMQVLNISLKVLTAVEGHIEEAVNTGKLATARLDQIREIREARNRAQ